MKKNLILAFLFIMFSILCIIIINMNKYDELDAERSKGIIETSINNGDQYNVGLIDSKQLVKKQIVKLSETSNIMTIDFYDGSILDIYYYKTTGRIYFC